MQILTCFLILASSAVRCGAVQVARVVPSPVGDAAQTVRHNAYVDSKVRQVVANFLNHEYYHQRNVVFPSDASVLPTFVSNFTTAAVSSSSTRPSTKQLLSPSSTSTYAATTSSQIPSNLQPDYLPPSNLTVGAFANATNGTYNYNSSIATGLSPVAVPSGGSGSSYLSRHSHAGSLTLTKDLTLAANTAKSWKDGTDNTCSAQLSKLDNHATSPSGLSVCYNVRSLDNNTGVFHADLRLYRIGPPTGDWTQMDNAGFSAGIAYPDASVSLEQYVQKRDLFGFVGSAMHDTGTRLQIRSGAKDPQLLQTLSFLGQVNNGSVPELRVEGIAFALLTPKINLAGSTRNGTPISILLSLQDASFVSGLFVDLHSAQIGTVSIMTIGSREWVSKANTFSGFPASLVFVGVWTFVMLLLEGIDLGRKIKCRYEDLRSEKRAKEKEGVET